MLIVYSSGSLNAKQRELAELQAMAQRRLKSTSANIAEGMKAARDVRRDLEWTQKRVRYVRTCLFHISPFRRSAAYLHYGIIMHERKLIERQFTKR